MKNRKSSEENAQRSNFRALTERPERLFAVGDIHGYSDELGVLLDYLVEEKRFSPSDQLIFIGDYIDRGIGSKQVIERLLEVRREWPRTVFLKGNHEEMLLSFLGFGGRNGEFYLRNGGSSFFQSYGIEGFGSLTSLREQLPEAHLRFIQGLELAVSVGDFIFVHAGLSPKRPLAQQSSDDLLWIREEFIHHPHPFEKTVVFGHTAFNQIFVDLPYRIGIDTGVAYGNKLSAVELTQGEFYQIDVDGRAVYQGRLW